MKYLRLPILFVLAGCIFIGVAFKNVQAKEINKNLTASLTEFHFRHTDTNTGLPGNNVWSIARDHQGYMWFGTRYSGLARFDGYETKHFKHIANDPDSLSHNYVWALLSDSKGRLWVGTNGGGLNRFDPKTEKFIRYPYDEGDASSIPHANIKALYEDRQGTIWIGTNRGLSKYIETTDTFETITYTPGNQNGLSGPSIRAIAEDPGTGDLWLGTRKNGITVYHRATDSFTHYRFDAQDPSSLSNDAVNHIYFSSLGEIWVATREGLNKFNPQQKNFTRYVKNSDAPGQLSGNWVNATMSDLSDKLWVATLSGLDVLDTRTGEFKPVKPVFGNRSAFKGTAINTIYFDKSAQGALWFGTQNNGVCRLGLRGENFYLLEPNPNMRETISGQAVRAVMVDSANRLLVGTDAGLDIYDGKTFAHIGKSGSAETSLSDLNVRSLSEDKSGNIWIGTTHGLNRYDGSKITQYLADDGKGAVSGNHIATLGRDQLGDIWAGINGVGVSRFSNGRFENHFFYHQDNSKPVSFYPKAIVSDPGEGGTWVGTNNMGLAHIDNHGNPIDFHLLFPDHPGSEVYNFVSSIKVARDRMVWLGTNQGIMVFDPQNEKIIARINEADGLPSNTIMAIEFDHSGNLWAATPDSLNKIDMLSRKVVTTYTAKGNFFGARILANASTIDSYGNLYWGTDRGLLFFTPAALRKNPIAPETIISKIEILGESKTISGLSSLRVLPAALGREGVVIEPGGNVISISFAAFDFAAPERAQYRYILEGHDLMWRQATAQSRTASYSNIPPGNYLFRVQGANGDGVWSDTTTDIQITALPFWWQTGSARVLFGIAGVILLVSLLMLQRLLAKRKRAALEQLVEERTKALNMAKLEAEHANSVKTKFLATMSHELRTPLNAIIGFSDVVRQGIYGEMGNSKYAEYIDHIHSSGEHLLSLINEVLDLASIEVGKLTIRTEEVCVTDMIDSALMLMRPRAEKGRVRIVNNAPTDLPFINVDRIRFKQVLLNFLSNAVKFTPEEGVVTISAQVDGDEFLSIRIEDSGVGMTPEELDLAKLPFERVRESSVSGIYEGTGLGMPLSIRIVDEMDGYVAIKSEPNVGTSVTIYFPVAVTSKRTA